ncbi:hypothetical protein DSECCO2_455050 [anaerobic digester metagenome]
MKSKVMTLVLAALLALPALAGAVTEKDFEVKTTQNLIDLCTAAPKDPLYNQALNFCHGYLVGAYQYYAAAAAGPEGVTLVCFPENPPTRNEAIGMFVEWAKAHPQYMGEKPVETEFRFLMETWPCK